MHEIGEESRYVPYVLKIDPEQADELFEKLKHGPCIPDRRGTFTTDAGTYLRVRASKDKESWLSGLDGVLACERERRFRPHKRGGVTGG